MRFHRFVVGTTLLGVACGGDADPASTNEAAASAFRFCKQEHTAPAERGEATVVVCDEFFAEAPFIRVPGSTAQADLEVELYAAFVFGAAGSSPRLVDSDGTSYRILGSGGEILDGFDVTLDPYLPASLKMPTSRALYSVYWIKGQIETVQANGAAVRAIRISAARTAVTIPQHVIDSMMLGSWEGWASAGLKSGESAPGCFGERVECFDRRIRVPIRVTFRKLGPPDAQFVDYDGATLPGQDLFRAEGQIDNLSDPITFSDGRCMPSLRSLGTANPFRNAVDGSVSANRALNMHSPGDNEFVFGYPKGFAGVDGMNPSALVAALHPARFIQKSPEPSDWDWLASTPHAPNNGHYLELSRVAASPGASCANPVAVDLTLPIAGRYLARYAADAPSKAVVAQCLGFLGESGATDVVDYSAQGSPYASFRIETQGQRDGIAANTSCFIELTLQDDRR